MSLSKYSLVRNESPPSRELICSNISTFLKRPAKIMSNRPPCFFSTAPDFCSRQPETLPRSLRERKKIPSVPKFFFRGDAFTHFFAEELILGQKLERTRKKSVTESKSAFLKKVSPFEILKKDGWENLKKLFFKELGFCAFLSDLSSCAQFRNWKRVPPSQSDTR